MANPQTENGYTRIANELLEALARLNLSPYEARVLFAIVRKTYGYNKKADMISLSQLDEIVKIGRVSISKAIRKLELKAIVIVSREQRIPVIQFNKNYDEWCKPLYVYRDTRPWYHKKNKCEFCKKNKAMEKHHIIPKEVKGSQTKSENIAHLCKECHGKIHLFIREQGINEPLDFQALYSMLIKLMSSELTTSIWNRVLPEWETLVSAKQTTKVSAEQTTTKDKRNKRNINKRKTSVSFDSFWNIYPRKIGKKMALKAWNKIQPDQKLWERIQKAITIQKEMDQWKKDKGRFIPHASTWLNQERWDDEVEPQNFETGGKPGKFANLGTKV